MKTLDFRFWCWSPLWAVGLILLGVEATAMHSSILYGLDFNPSAEAARGLLDGEPYRAAANQPFVYPPSAALLLLPTALLPPTAATGAGFVLALLAAVALAGLTARVGGWDARGPAAPVILMLLTFGGVGHGAIEFINVSIVVAAALAASVVLALSGRWGGSAIVLGLSAALKPLSVPALLLFLIPWRGRPLWTAIAIPVALNLLVLPWLDEPLAFFTEVVPDLLRGDTLADEFNSSLSVVLSDVLPASLVLTCRVLVLVAAALVLYRLRTRTDAVAFSAFAAVPILAIALASGTDEAHYGLVAIPLIAAAIRFGSSLSRAFAVAGALTLIGFQPLLALVYDGPDWTHTFGQLCMIACAAPMIREHRAAVDQQDPSLSRRG